MPEFLKSAFASEDDVSVSTLITRQLLALALGCVVGYVYRIAQTQSLAISPRQRTEMLATLVLLTVLISMMTAVIGDNIARAFSIVGALSIVRFRTVVEDTRDTAFVIFAVAVGMAVGAGHILIPIITIPIVAAAALLFRPASPQGSQGGNGSATAGVGGLGGGEFRLTVRCAAGFDAAKSIRDAATRADAGNSLPDGGPASGGRGGWGGRLLGIESVRQGAAYEHAYAITLKSDDAAAPLIAELDRIEGVQNVELRRM